MRQGEIRPLHTGGRSLRVLIVSGDQYNQRSAPWVAPVRRAPDLPPGLVGLHESDPLAGAADLRRIVAVDAADLGEPVGIIGGHTMSRVRQAVADICEA